RDRPGARGRVLRRGLTGGGALSDLRHEPPLAQRRGAGVSTASTQPGRLGVGIVGAGSVGPVIGAALAGAGHAIVGIASVTERNRDRAAAMLPDVPVLEIPDLIERSELVVLAVPESELESLVAGLAAVGAWQPGQLVLHTAPGLGCAVLG